MQSDRPRNAATFPVLLALIVMLLAAPARAGNVDLPRFPSISPDGTTVVFSWRGDLWKAPIAGGTALRLTRHPGDDLESAWSRDGQRIAFTSNRNGYTNIYMMNADGTKVRQVTDIDRACHLRGFGVDEDGRDVIVFHGYHEGDVYRSHRPYMISPDGGEIERLHDAFGSYPAVSPDGERIVFVRGGWYYGWNRRHYRGSESQDVWLYDRADGSFTQLTTWDGNDGKPRWGSDRTIYFMSDREDDCVNIYQMSADDGEETIARLTDFTDRDVHDFDISADASTLIFMNWDSLYTLDLDNPAAAPVRLQFTATEDETDNYEVRSIARQVSDAALSPDGQVMATVAYGRVYVRNVDDRSPTRQVTGGHDRAKDIAWSPCGVRLYFTSDRDGTESIYAATVTMTRGELVQAYEKATRPEDIPEDEPEDDPAEPEEAIAAEDEDEESAREDEDPEEDPEEEEKKDLPDPERWHDALRFEITPVIESEHNDQDVHPSPCGRYLSFRRSQGDIMIYEYESGETRKLVPGWDRWADWRFSPHGHYVAYSMNDLDFSANVWIVPSDGSADPVNISRHPRNDVNPRWSADGKILSFRSNRIRSGQRSNYYDVWAVYLDRELEGLSRKELDEYYEEAGKAAGNRKPLPVDPDEREFGERPELDLDDAYLRLRRITRVEGSVTNNEMTPAGDRILFNGQVDGSWSLYSIEWDGSSRRRLGGSVNMQHMTLTGDKAVFVHGSRAATVSPTGGSYDYIDISDSIRIDLQKQASQKFTEAARTLGELFYHNEMNYVDWDGLTEQYHELALQTRTGEEFNYVSNRFLGELNASHLGVRGSTYSSPHRQAMGRLGIDRERVELDNGSHGYRITHIVPEGPAEIGTMKLEVGDIIIGVDLEPFGLTDTLETALRGLVGDESIITVLRTINGEEVELHTLLRPISYGRDRQLRYEAWRLENAEMIADWSGGRVGYIHIQGMNQPSLDVFKRDLYAAMEGKEGLIIDVRNNGGGWTADRVLNAIMMQPHAYTIPRGADPEQTGHYPQDRLLIPRFVGEVNMLCNEKSFSNAEIVSHAFKTLGRGTLVGQETYGGVISTGSFSLIDGTSVRLPFRGWFLPDGTDMEHQGAIPDLLVEQTPEAESADDDEQLRAALDDLMERLD